MLIPFCLIGLFNFYHDMKAITMSCCGIFINKRLMINACMFSFFFPAVILKLSLLELANSFYLNFRWQGCNGRESRA